MEMERSLIRLYELRKSVAEERQEQKLIARLGIEAELARDEAIWCQQWIDWHSAVVLTYQRAYDRPWESTPRFPKKPDPEFSGFTVPYR